MVVRIHYVGCLVASRPMAPFIDNAMRQAESLGAQTLWRSDAEARFVCLDAPDAELIVLASRLVLAHQPSALRFGFASGVMESGAQHEIRISRRSIAQAVELAHAAHNGEVLLSSQLGSLLQISQAQVATRLRGSHVTLDDGRRATAYWIDWAAGLAEA